MKQGNGVKAITVYLSISPFFITVVKAFFDSATIFKHFWFFNYEFYEEVNAFYKLVSRNYGYHDMALMHFYISSCICVVIS